MDQEKASLQAFSREFHQALQKARVEEHAAEVAELQREISSPNFWHDNQKATAVAQHEAKLRTQIEPWQKIEIELRDLQEIAAASDDPDLAKDIAANLDELKKQFAVLRQQLSFSGPYDDHDAILRLHAGAGGTDAQDWTEMLVRMYLRWAERTGMKTQVIEQSPGEEAGVKSTTLSVSGAYAYGKLRGEHGVHRLVRLSPFNADNLRQTSFALVEVLPQIDTPDEVQLDEKDLKIDVFRAGGHGGQSVNTTDSAVRITHIPTGIVVSIQNERSQLQNKETAMKLLRSKLAQLQLEQHKERVEELKGPTKSAEWGSQIRSYVLHPYTLVKDNRTKHEERDATKVLDGAIDPFINAYIQLW